MRVTKMISECLNKGWVIMKKAGLRFPDTQKPFFWNAGTQPTGKVSNHLKISYKHSQRGGNLGLNGFDKLSWYNLPLPFLIFVCAPHHLHHVLTPSDLVHLPSTTSTPTLKCTHATMLHPHSD